MKRLFLILLVLLLSAIAALWFHEQGGYVLIAVGSLTLESSLFLAVGTMLAAFLVALFAVGLIRRTVRVPSNVRGWLEHRRTSQNRERLVKGLVRLAEGEYGDAERALVQSAGGSETPVLHYLSAAWAAHRLGAGTRRDSYLALADKSDRQARLAIGLLQARLYLEDEQWETAFATLNYLLEKWPRHPRVLEMMTRACEALQDWERLRDILPALRRYGAMESSRVAELERAASVGLLQQASRQGEQAVRQAWERLPRSARADHAVNLAYVDALMANDPGSEEAEKLLRTGLRKSWDAARVERYGQLAMNDPSRPFNLAEGWLRERPEDPVLLLATARLAIRNRIWGRARSYLEASVARDPSAEAWYLLADLLERLGESAEAQHAFRRAAERAGGFRSMPEMAAVHQPEPAGADEAAGGR